ncbi:hypothetical protein ACFPOI_34035 [Nonomuraea angiospora]|uniref:Uncharacterized protein n=1 Tax=Nonomuraea angiospora TaxID=46172 RepID=A0ABR9LT80_9ACTN|nr:hypothetical protein [Nonomuraea angiospora]MBE1583863.1 hypothetical protein [Nonomuraea angiospora]
MAHKGSHLRKPTIVLSTAAMLGTAVALLTGGTASAGQASSGMALAVTCGDGSLSADWYFDSSHYNPSACAKCQEAGARLEATGLWRAYCKRRYNQAGTLTRVDLYRFCLACRSAEAALAAGPSPWRLSRPARA